MREKNVKFILYYLVESNYKEIKIYIYIYSIIKLHFFYGKLPNPMKSSKVRPFSFVIYNTGSGKGRQRFYFTLLHFPVLDLTALLKSYSVASSLHATW